MKLRRTLAADEVGFADTYRQLHQRHALSWANGLSGAALGIPVGADTVYVDGDNETPAKKEIERTIN